MPLTPADVTQSSLRTLLRKLIVSAGDLLCTHNRSMIVR